MVTTVGDAEDLVHEMLDPAEVFRASDGPNEVDLLGGGFAGVDEVE